VLDRPDFRSSRLIRAQIEGLMLFRLDKDNRRAQFEAVRAAVRKVLLTLATVP
jgi:hypothetical protein